MSNVTRRRSRLLLAAAALAALVPSAAVHAQSVPQPGPGEVGSCDVNAMNDYIFFATHRSARNNGHVGECDPKLYGISEDDLWNPAMVKANQAKVKAYFDKLAETPPPPAAPQPAPASQPAPVASPPAPQTTAPVGAAATVADCPDLAALANGDTAVADDGADGPPSEDVIRQVIAAEFVVDYVNPITCLRPVIEVGPIRVGAPVDKVIHVFDVDTTPAYPVKAVVKVNIFTGDTYLRSYQRGVNGEVFFLYRDDFGAWRLVTGAA